MQLTLHADYSLRILLYLAENPHRPVSTREISEAYGISRNHLVRVVETLNDSGFIEVTEGRYGGARLMREPADINLGDVVRRAEPGFRIVECFDSAKNTCPIVPACRLKNVLHQALASFFAVLDGYSLADLSRTSELSKYLQIAPARQF